MADRDWDSIRLPRTVVADAATREALSGFTTEDLGRLYRQTDDGSYWMLTATTPTWQRVLTSTPDVSYIDITPDEHDDVAYQEGRLFYCSDHKALTVYDDQTGTALEVGQETRVRAYNDTGVQIDDGAAVYISGASGNKPTVALALATALSTAECIGLATHDIADGTYGWVTVRGVVRGYDTSGFTEGDQLWVSQTVAGALQNTNPTNGAVVRRVGKALNSTVSGQVLVNPQPPCQEDHWKDMQGDVLQAAGAAAMTIIQWGDTGVYVPCFARNQNDAPSFIFQMQHDWNFGSVKPHIHIVPLAATGGTIVFDILYTWVEASTAIPITAAAWTSAQVQQVVTAGDSLEQVVVGLATIAAPSSPGVSQILMMKVQRTSNDPSDDYDGDSLAGTSAANVAMIGMDVHYQTGSRTGSQSEYPS